MTKKEAYLELAEKFCGFGRLEFVCNKLEKLLNLPDDFVDSKSFPELWLFRFDNSYAWLTDDDLAWKESNQVKSLIMLFCIEVLKDEKKVQKKTKSRNIQRLS